MHITEDFRVSFKTVVDNARHGQATANFEFPFFTKDKRRIEFMMNATPRCNAKGEVRTSPRTAPHRGLQRDFE